MIFGVGTDLVEIDRMNKSLQSPAFCSRVFGAEERAFLENLSPAHRAASAAACFAAKEAFLKACGVGLGRFALADIQALRRESGAPYYALGGPAAKFCQDEKLTPALSLSHEGGLALAFAVLETK